MDAGALVGGAFLSASLQVIFDRLASRDVVNFIRGNKQLDYALLKKMKRKLLTVHAVLDDAEAKQITNPAVKEWMDELKVVVYDAEDVLDEIGTEHLRSKIEATADSQTSSSMSVSTCDVQSINSRMEEILDRLEDIVQDRDVLGLKEGVLGEKLAVHNRWPSTSLVDESLIYGRDEIKEELVQLLLFDHDNAKRRTTDYPIGGVISIVGMGGSGKTTLAQLLYNDTRVKKRFDLKAWVCVSEEFDPVRVTKTILEAIDPSLSNTTDLNLLQVRLKESINMKKFLIVLDDVWNEDSCDWDKLQIPFIAGAKGSKIMVTTRSTKVALAMRAVHIHCLDVLSAEDGWSLLKKLAFENNGESSEHPQLGAIGKKIVHKCQGLPLAIKVMGSLLHCKVEAREWNDVLSSELWDLPKDAILPALRLSYSHLPSHLKRCFSYCAVFPKDYEFQKEKLVLLWMAEGLLDQPKRKKRMEVVGNLYFRELLSKSFFQNSTSSQSCFVMHDLINDLARSVSGEFSICLEDEKIHSVSQRTRHLSYLANQFDVYERFDAISETKCLRTILPRYKYLSYHRLSNRVLHKLLLEMKYLRVLSLCQYIIVDLPDSIDKLEHLRYLDISGTMIRKLPKSVCNLYNLQTIILSGCRHLIELPSRLENLINLCYLDISDTAVKEMPNELYRLKDLRSLPTFIVGQNGGLRLRELRELSGSLTISKLENVIKSEANMKDKRYLDELKLNWYQKNTSDQGDVVQNRRDMLRSLQPHTNLKTLHINNFGGSGFPDWVGDPSFLNLVAINLVGCDNCSSLPPLGQLPTLEHLTIRGMDGIERVGSEFYHYGNVYSSHAIKPCFPSLQTLSFSFMSNWEKWLCCGCRRGEFPRLQEFCISNCPKLTGNLPKQLRSLKKLQIFHCESLVASLRAPEIREWTMLYHGKFRLKRPACGFNNLQTSKIEISDISQLEELPPRLEKLLIRECDSIEWILEEGVLQTSSCCVLQSLDITSCGFSRPLLHTVGLPTTLKSLSICKCNKLEFLLHGLLRSHHPFLQSLSIEHCGSCNPLSLSLSLSIFPRLNALCISDFEGLEFLYVSILEGDLTSLNHLNVHNCPDIVYIELPPIESGQYHIYKCRKLKLLALAHTLPLSSSLESLSLEDCPELLFQRDGLPSNLRILQILSCNQLTSEVDWNWGLQRLASLTKFRIGDGCQDVESFPNQSLLPSSLAFLRIENLPNLKSLDCKGLQHLTSLTTLSISNCPEFQSFGEERLHQLISSLTTLSISNCPKFQSFGEEGLQHLTSLEKLEIYSLPVLKSLREVGIQHLTSLKKLSISHCGQLQYLTKERLPNSLHSFTVEGCPLLKHCCQFEKGQDWEYVAHVPCIVIEGVLY